MAFVVQNDSGTALGANAYIDVGFFDNYHADRGVDTSGFTETQKQQAIVKATDYVDARFIYVGERQNSYRIQTTEWPRLDAIDASQQLVQGIPYVIKRATAEYALLALTSDLMPAPPSDASQRLVTSKREKVGPIEEETSYSATNAYTMPIYPLADRLVLASGLARSSNVRNSVRT